MKLPSTRALGALLAAALALAALDASAGDRKRLAGKLDPAGLYHNYCSVCHGDNGDGNSRAKNSLIPPPADFTNPQLQSRYTKEYIAAIVKMGKPNTAMVGWKTQLNDTEINALAEYVKATFVDRAGDASIKQGRSLYGHFCVGCHGVRGDGVSTAGNAMKPPPRDFTSEAANKELSRDRIVAAVAVGRRGTSMNGFAGQMSPQDIDAVADYVQKWLMAGQSSEISGVNAHAGREPRK